MGSKQLAVRGGAAALMVAGWFGAVGIAAALLLDRFNQSVRAKE